jgi:hypothetical protein
VTRTTCLIIVALAMPSVLFVLSVWRTFLVIQAAKEFTRASLMLAGVHAVVNLVSTAWCAKAWTSLDASWKMAPAMLQASTTVGALVFLLLLSVLLLPPLFAWHSSRRIRY